jgi:DNA recombination protein RmuC
MYYLICCLGGALVGVLGTLVVKGRTTPDGDLREALGRAQSQAQSATETLERERVERAQEISSLERLFEGTASRVLASVVGQFNAISERVNLERDSKFDLSLKPLENALSEYRQVMERYGSEHVAALGDVRHRAEALLAAQSRTQEETKKLTSLLGRGDQRGHWGEVQLANVLEASGLVRGIDYDLQVSALNEAGRVVRPDGIVHVGETNIAIDAKFPFDAFEAGVGAEDSSIRAAHFLEHASALRSHVKTLSEKAYWAAVSPAPEFVICFVPSDAALSVALESDPTLHAFAARGRVLLAGPTNLLALLWSVAMVASDHHVAENARAILKEAEAMVDRVRGMVEPLVRMGKSLSESVDSYNKLVRSAESRLIPAANRMRRLGGVSAARPLPAVAEINERVVEASAEKWTPAQPGLFEELGTGGE